MPNRGRNYMDRLLGRNEGSESRDFTDGRRYGEEERFFDDPFNDSASEWNRNSEFSDRDREYQGRYHRTQASRNRPRPNQYKSDSERDYSVRRNSRDYRDNNPNGTSRSFDYNIDDGDNVAFRGDDDRNSFWNDSFNSERERGMNRRNDSFYQNDFRNTEPRKGGFFGKGPKGWKRSDERIKEEVSEALYRDYHVDASEIEVDVKDGVVTLSGTVDSRDAKRSAEECIENLSGVSDVHNRIRIAGKNNVSNLREGDSGEKRALS